MATTMCELILDSLGLFASFISTRYIPVRNLMEDIHGSSGGNKSVANELILIATSVSRDIPTHEMSIVLQCTNFFILLHIQWLSHTISIVWHV